jgi:hypothetical protein
MEKWIDVVLLLTRFCFGGSYIYIEKVMVLGRDVGERER